jgi:hypothetical protein
MAFVRSKKAKDENHKVRVPISAGGTNIDQHAQEFFPGSVPQIIELLNQIVFPKTD